MNLLTHIRKADHRVRDQVIETPLVPLPTLSRKLGVEIVAKAECLQRTGSFKYRGAMNRLLVALEEGVSHIVTASTGNHGLAVATASRELGLPCDVHVSRSASSYRIERIAAAGARVVIVDGDALAAETTARDVAAQQSRLFVSPYNDFEVVAGQGTIGLEVVRAASEPFDVTFVATGGGGLVAGIACAIKDAWPQHRVVSCFPAASPVLADSLKAGHIVNLDVTDTIADAVAGNLEQDTITLDLCRGLVDETLILPEEEIEHAVRHCLLEEHLVVEGSAGLAVAGARRWIPQSDPQPSRVLVILCGGNIDRHALVRLLT